MSLPVPVETNVDLCADLDRCGFVFAGGVLSAGPPAAMRAVFDRLVEAESYRSSYGRIVHDARRRKPQFGGKLDSLARVGATLNASG